VSRCIEFWSEHDQKATFEVLKCNYQSIIWDEYQKMRIMYSTRIHGDEDAKVVVKGDCAALELEGILLGHNGLHDGPVQ
jgi:hypothetical protein